VLVVNPKQSFAYTGITETQTGLFAKNKVPEVSIMKLASIIVAVTLAIPAVSSFAQSNQPLTRSEVKAQLVQVEQAGYNPSMDHTTYPASIQAAEARVAVQNGQGYGGVADGVSASGGAPAHTGNTVAPVYFGH
jgi:hypothetical protein